ncbi:MAG TPA: hypothetical protein VL523_10540 [Terriglobia bacterium]|nr:hypothetical protein [Terriglobia bacterium]
MRCLDYTPEKAGSPVFINDCRVAHPVVVEELTDGEHTVGLHAGSKVIGIPYSVVVSQAGAPPSTTKEIPLQLLTPGNTTLSGNHFFTLDGDSIILTSDHDFVAKIQNARGAVGTPVVLGWRTLADNEFWDFVATDGSDRDPTSGFVRIGYPGDPGCSDADLCIKRLYSVVSAAGPGTVIRLGRTLTVGGEPSLDLGTGVTIRGDRRGRLLGAELYTNFDGAGKPTQQDFVVHNGVAPTGFQTGESGTYTVSSNCTGSAVINFPSGPPINLMFVLTKITTTNQANEIHTVVANSGVNITSIGSQINWAF